MTAQDIILKSGKRYLTVRQFGRELGVTRQNMNYHISKGHIKTMRVQMSPISFYRLIPIEELEKAKVFINKKRKAKNNDSE